MTSASAFRSELAGLYGSICADNATPQQVLAACNRLFALFCQESGLDTGSYTARLSRQLTEGKAIGPTWAAHCVLDFMRTRAFLRGALEALKNLDGGHVLYAGTGPFATLLLPLLPFFPFERFSFTLLDIHPANLSALRRLLTALDLPERCFRLVTANATEYRCEAPVDVLIMELMQPGLAEEPQVAAMRRLCPQMRPGGILIPQKIRVEAALRHSRRDRERMMGMAPSEPVLHHIACLMELGAESHDTFAKGFSEQLFDLPTTIDPEFNQLVLVTEIQVWGEEWLRYAGSALTQALPLMRFESGERPGKVAFQYHTGEHPGFSHRFLP